MSWNARMIDTFRIGTRFVPNTALALSLTVGAPALLTGCGAVYYPVSVPSERSLFVRDDERFPYDLQLVNLTIASAREANIRWRYQPKQLPAGLYGNAADPSSYPQLAEASGPVDVLATTQSSALPPNSPSPYILGRGDELVIVNAAEVGADQIVAQRDPSLRNTYRVTQDGNVFIPELGLVEVAGKTLENLRRDVQSRMAEVFVAPIAVVNVTGFNSQRYSVTGSSIQPAVEPITMQQVSLREAIIKIADRNTIFDGAEVILERNGQSYSVPYSDILYGSAGANTTMLDGDRIRIRDARGEEARRATFDQTVQAVELDRSRISAQNQQLQIQDQQLRLQQLQNSLAKQRLSLDQTAAQRAEQELAIQQTRLQLEQARFDQTRAEEQRAEEQLRIQREAEARQQQLLQLQLQGADRANAELELARSRADRERAAFELDRARADREAAQLQLQQQTAQRNAQQLELDRQRFDLDNQRIALENQRLQLSREDQSLKAQADRRAQEQLDLQRLNTQQQLGGLDRDHVYVSGEVGETLRMPMPYGKPLSLADALFEAKGFEPSTGDPRGIHVVRTENAGAARPKVYVFTLDARNIANLSAATVFEMRPNDVLYVTPQPVTNWNRALTQILGGTNALIGTATRGL